MTENERVKYLREVLLPARTGKKVSQDEFVNGLGIKKSALSLIETGRNNLTDSVRLLICNKYNVSDSWIRTGAGEPFIPNPDTELDALCDKYGLNGNSRAFIKEFAELSEDERKAILKYISKVAAALREQEAQQMTDAEIDAAAEDYKRQLREQREAGDGSSASRRGA